MNNKLETISNLFEDKEIRSIWVWKDGGITKPMEYALLTNEIYKGWSGMKVSEYKVYKGIRKESLRDI